MPLPAPIVGIIANPASGRDLRRLTANAGLYSSTDKASAIQRLLAAFGATGIGQVLLPSDMTGIAAAVLKASQGPGAREQHWPTIEILDLPLTQTVADTRLATRRMVERGVAMIAVLGGDGTHKAVAAEAGDIPLLTLSTGTNNAFPELREATSAGLAGGLLGLLMPGLSALLHNASTDPKIITGDLYSSIHTHGVRKKRGGFGKHITIGVKHSEKGAYYANPVEHGHGGPGPAPAHPFVRPAFDVRKDEAYQIMKNILKDELLK